MKKLVTLISLIIGVIFFTPSTQAQTNYPIAELGNCTNAGSCYTYCQVPENTPACWSYGKYVLHKNVLGEQIVSLSFPIAELGNCSSAQACKAYCSQPTNYNACSTFGKKKGLIKEHSTEREQKEKLIQKAKEKLGCTDESSCRTLCSDPTNHEKCSLVAREVGLQRASQVSESSKPQELLEKAKQELGCDSQTSCKDFCSKPENKEKCMEFGRKNKQEKQEKREEWREKNREELRKNKEDWCKENPDRCKEIRELKASDAPQNYEDKMKFCKENPEKCQQFRENNTEKRDMKKKQWEKKGCTTEGECMSLCKENPDRCPGFPKPSGFSQGRPEGGFQKPEGMNMPYYKNEQLWNKPPQSGEHYQSTPPQQPPQEANN